MDIRKLAADYAVSPQIAPEDLRAVVDAGFTTVICNRPDSEVPPEFQAGVIRDAAEAAGLRFVENPVVPGDLGPDILKVQADALSGTGPVLAYCASGNRSAIVWSLVRAPEIGADAVLEATRAVGYDHSALRPQFAAVAEKR